VADGPLTEPGKWLLFEYARTPGDPKWFPGMGLETTIIAIEDAAAGVTLDPRGPEDGLREAAEAVVDAYEGHPLPIGWLVTGRIAALRAALRSTPAAPHEVLVKDEGYWAGYNAAKREFTPAPPQPATQWACTVAHFDGQGNPVPCPGYPHYAALQPTGDAEGLTEKARSLIAAEVRDRTALLDARLVELRKAAQTVVDDWFGTYDAKVRHVTANTDIAALDAALRSTPAAPKENDR